MEWHHSRSQSAMVVKWIGTIPEVNGGEVEWHHSRSQSGMVVLWNGIIPEVNQLWW